jgi:3-deoxy-D-manno-octulosonic acid kinase
MNAEPRSRRFLATGLRCVVNGDFEAGARDLGLDKPDSFDRALLAAERCRGGRGENYLLSSEHWPERVRLRPLRHGGFLGRWTGGRYFSARRSEREFELWRLLEGRGAPIPRAVLAASRRRGVFWAPTFGALNREDARDALDWLREERRSPALIRSTAIALARSIRRFHDAGAIHGDLHLANVLIEGSNADPQCWLVDLGRTTLEDRLSPSIRMRELMRLWRSIEKTHRTECLDLRVAACFLSSYCDGDRVLRRSMLSFAGREDRRLRRHRFGWRIAGHLASMAFAIGLLACSESKGTLDANTHVPAEARPRLSLLATGDTGRIRSFGGLFEGQLAVAHSMRVEDRDAPVDGVIFLGDNFYFHGLDREHLVERIRRNLVEPYCHFLDMDGPRGDEVEPSCSIPSRLRHPVPIYAVLGNHDLELPESPTLQREVIPEFLPRWQMSSSIAEAVELTSGVSLILFESEVAIDDEPAMSEALIAAISRARGPWRILAAHRPIATDDNGGLPVGGYPVWVRDAIAKAGRPVQLAITGHHHNLQAFALEEPTALLQIGAGSGSRATPPLAKDEVPSLFSSIELGFARIDLVGTGETERLSVSLFGTARWPLLAQVSRHVERARFEVDLKGSVRSVSTSGDLADGLGAVRTE